MLKRIARSFLDLVFPPLCLHCEIPIGGGERLFCSDCSSEILLIDPAHRCPFCFREHEMAKLSACLHCRRHPPVLNRLAAACDEQGPAKSLLNGLKSGLRPSLAKGAAALMAAQFVRLEWPFPDLISFVPLPLMRQFERGYNQSQLLAEGLGLLLERPVAPLLKQRGGSYRQSLLIYTQREALDRELFALQTKLSIKGKIILLIDDSLSTGTTMNCCAEILADEGPKAIYGLVFSRGM